MLTYTTKFPINYLLTKRQFVETVIKWNQGSKYDKISEIVLDEESYNCLWNDDKVSLNIQELSEYEIIGSRLEREDEYGVWYTDFILDNRNKTISISVSLETTEFTTDFFPVYYPPFFVKMIIHSGYSGDDNGILVSNKEHSVLNCSESLKSAINNNSRFMLPIVFISKMIGDKGFLNINKLAFRLQGVAHVVYESEHIMDLTEVMEELEFNDHEIGKICILYPNHNKKNSVINSLVLDKEGILLEDKIVNDIYNYMNSRMRKPIDTWDGLLNEKLYIENRNLLSNQNEIKKENNDLYEVFGEQLEKMEESNIRLSNEIQKLTQELQGLRLKYSDKEKESLLCLGDEKEFYTDEIKEIVLDIMSEYQKNCRQDTRRWHIIKDLLESNKFKGLPEKRKNEMKNALKGYTGLNASLKGFLETMGLEISDDGKHYKWTYYGDQRYVATVAKTCSDRRAGLNISSVIEKLMF